MHLFGSKDGFQSGKIFYGDLAPNTDSKVVAAVFVNIWDDLGHHIASTATAVPVNLR